MGVTVWQQMRELIERVPEAARADVAAMIRSWELHYPAEPTPDDWQPSRDEIVAAVEEGRRDWKRPWHQPPDVQETD